MRNESQVINTISTGTGQILFSISGRQEVSVKSILGHFWKNWNETYSNPAAIHDGGPPSW